MESTTDISPSTAEFLEKEKMFYEEHISNDVASTSTTKCGTISAHEQMNSSSDEEISSLLKKMKGLLSPQDLEFLKTYEGKDVEELLKETEEFIQRSSPLFQNLSTHSSCSESSGGVVSSPKKCIEQNANIDVLITKMESLAEETSSAVINLGSSDSSKCDDLKSDVEEMPCISTLNDVTKLDSEIQIEKDLLSEDEASGRKEPEKTNSDEELTAASESQSECNENNNNNSDDLISDVCEKVVENNNYVTNDNANNNVLLEVNCSILSDVNDNNNHLNVNKLLELNFRDKLSLSDLDAPVCSLQGNLINNDTNNNNNNTKMEIEHDLQRLQLALDEAEKNYNANIEILRKQYEEEIIKLKEHIKVLNVKLAEFQSRQYVETGAGDNGGLKIPSADEKKIQSLKAEVVKQEELIVGYQRENKKVFLELASAKKIVTFFMIAAIPLFMRK